jgi:hypothetical protein
MQSPTGIVYFIVPIIIDVGIDVGGDDGDAGVALYEVRLLERWNVRR